MTHNSESGSHLGRRDVLRSAAAATAVFALPQFGLAEAAPLAGQKKRSLILLWQDGGPSHFETFDPKPDAPAEFRGELGVTPTSLAGIHFCDAIPRLARLADKMCVIRSLHQPSSDHVVGSHNVLTGWYGQTEGSKSRYPDMASVISRMRRVAENSNVAIGASTDPRIAQGMRGPSVGTALRGEALPQYIDISLGLHRGGPAFLGALDASFQVAGDPSKPEFVIQNLQSVDSASRFRERNQVLAQLDRLGKTHQDAAALEQLAAVEGFRRQAAELLAGGKAAGAFDLSREPTAVRDRFGRHLAGQQCLLARRLIESGVGIVAARFTPDGRGDYDKTMIGWDDHAVHGNIFAIMRKRGPQFDQAVSALISDLEERGMQDEVLLVVMGEFGRTPRVHDYKGCPGREHWGAAGCALVYGGGLQMGQVIGSTNDKGERPEDRPVAYQDVLATIYHSMGVNQDHTLLNSAGRPVPILSAGKPIPELTRSKKRVRKLTSKSAIVPSVQDSATLDLASLETLPSRERLRHVQTLVAHDSSIDDSTIQLLAECDQLQRLELNNAPLTDEGLVHLRGLRNLEELCLSGTRTSDKGLVHLRQLSRLRQFSFSGTAITLTGVIDMIVNDQQRTIGDALATMGLVRLDHDGQIRGVDVAATSFGDKEMQHLGQLPMLRELQLTATQVTDAGMSVLSRLPHVEELYVAKCNVSDIGLEHVATLSRLRAINIYGTKVTTAGLKFLMNLEHLEHLMVTDLRLSDAAVDLLKKKLPRLRVTQYTPA